MNRHKQRIQIVQALYSVEYNNDGFPSFVTDDYCKLTISSILEERDNIDKIISKNSESNIESIDKLVLQILRLAIYEILYKGTEPKICISEAINLALDFNSDKSYSFINGVLDSLVKK